MTITFERMSLARLRPWFEAGEAEYVDDLVRAGMGVEQARDKAGIFEDHFPAGVAAPGHDVFDVLHDGDPVGYVWIGPQSSGDPGEWWLWDIAIDERHRGRGFGRAALKLAEGEAARRGATKLGLKVFGFNTAARSLYESLGYSAVSLQMTKTLGG